MPAPASFDKPALWLALGGLILINLAIGLHFVGRVPAAVVTALLVGGALLAAAAWWRLRQKS